MYISEKTLTYTGHERLYRVVHTRHRARFSLLDRFKLAIGWPTDISLCVAVGIHLQDGKYKHMEICGVDTSIAVWQYEEPRTVEARHLDINLHELPKDIVTDKNIKE